MPNAPLAEPVAPARNARLYLYADQLAVAGATLAAVGSALALGALLSNPHPVTAFLFIVFGAALCFLLARLALTTNGIRQEIERAEPATPELCESRSLTAIGTLAQMLAASLVALLLWLLDRSSPVIPAIVLGAAALGFERLLWLRGWEAFRGMAVVASMPRLPRRRRAYYTMPAAAVTPREPYARTAGRAAGAALELVARAGDVLSHAAGEVRELGAGGISRAKLASEERAARASEARAARADEAREESLEQATVELPAAALEVEQEATIELHAVVVESATDAGEADDEPGGEDEALPFEVDAPAIEIETVRVELDAARRELDAAASEIEAATTELDAAEEPRKSEKETTDGRSGTPRTAGQPNRTRPRKPRAPSSRERAAKRPAEPTGRGRSAAR